MKPLPSIAQKLIFAMTCIFIVGKSVAQTTPGGPPLNFSHYSDSLTSDCQKTADGYYYKGFQLMAEPGSKVDLHFSAHGKSFKDLSLWIMEAKEGGATKKYFCNDHGGTCLGTIDFDSTFETESLMNVVFTTSEPGESIYFDADIYYGSPDALAFQPNGEFCWKIAYILKNSDNAFKFITPSGQESNDSKTTTAPMSSTAPTESYIHDGMFDLYYASTIERGSREETIQTFDQAATALKTCLGSNWKYTTTTDAEGYSHLSCTLSASNAGVSVKNLSYMGKNESDELVKYEIKLFVASREVQGNTVYELKISIANLFNQY